MTEAVVLGGVGSGVGSIGCSFLCGGDEEEGEEEEDFVVVVHCGCG